jgi:arylsulfatase A-like enzyme
MNLIWIVADTFRRDHLGAYGNGTIQTPTLDALARRSIRFDRHYAASFPTMPNRADFFTGRWTMSFMGWEPLPAKQVTVAQILAEKGYHTAAVVDTPFFIRKGFNYDLGFQTFFMMSGQEGSATRLDENYHNESRDVHASRRFESDLNAPRTFIQAMRWLEKHYKEDFFLYIDTWDPHEPWDAPEYYTELYWPDYDGEVIQPLYGRWQDYEGFTEEKVRKAHATYCGEVTMVDTWAGYLLRRVENMGLMENTSILFTSDHGFYFGEHEGLFGKMTLAKKKDGTRYHMSEGTANWERSPLYEELAATPLLIYMPDAKPGTYSGLTSAVDFTPTVLDIMGQEIPDWVEGRSLCPMVYNQGLKGREIVVSTMQFRNPGEMVRYVDDASRMMIAEQVITVTTDDWSLLYSAEPGSSELYHLPSDPKQEKNIIHERPEMAREIHQRLIEFMEETNVLPTLIKERSKIEI